MTSLQQKVAQDILRAYYKHEKGFNLPKNFSAVDLIALAGIETSLGEDVTSYPLGLFQFLEATWKDIENRILKGITPCEGILPQIKKDPLSHIDCQVFYALAYIENMHPSWGIPESGLSDGAQVALWWQSGGCARKAFFEALRSGSPDFCSIWELYQNRCLKVKAVPPCDRIARFESWNKLVVDFFGKVIVHGLAS